jgi:hypothetical protein
VLKVFNFGDEVVIEGKVLQIMQTINIFDFLNLIMLQVQHCKFLKDLQVFNLLNIQPLKMNGLELQHHGYFFFLRKGVCHGVIERGLGDEVDSNLVLSIKPLVAVLLGLGDFLLLDGVRFEISMLRKGDVGFHVK